MICHDQPFLTIIIHFQPSWTLFKHYQPSLINRFNHLLTMILDDGWFSWWWMMVDFHDGWWSTIMTSWIYLLSTPLYIYIIYIYQLSLIKLVFLLVTMTYQPLYISTIIYIYQLYITSFFLLLLRYITKKTMVLRLWESDCGRILHEPPGHDGIFGKDPV